MEGCLGEQVWGKAGQEDRMAQRQESCDKCHSKKTRARRLMGTWREVNQERNQGEVGQKGSECQSRLFRGWGAMEDLKQDYSNLIL
jgi:hypothetical protein